MRYARVLGIAASAGLVLPSLGWAQVRKDVNGEMVNASPSAGVPSGNLPISWTPYATGSGGGLAGRWDTGGSSNSFSTKWEDEDAQRALVNGGVKVGTYPGGHSMLFGGNTTAGAVGTYGIQQNISTTAGKVYWLSGAQGASGDWNSNQGNKYAFHYGIENGTGTSGGQISNGNIRRSGGTLLDGRFTHAVVATGTTMNAHVGMQVRAAASNPDINVFMDGVRVYEIDAPFNASLVNGGFEGSSTDISNYNAKGSDVGPVLNAQQDLLQGWIPLGGAVAQRSKYNQDSAIKNSGTYSFQFDMNKGNGRMYAAQRLDMGGAGGKYTITGMVRADSADSNAMIGIDPTGGLDPSSGSIIWSSASAVNTLFNSLSTGQITDTTGNGVTIFLAAGVYNSSLASVFRTGGDFGARFDDIAVSYVPEPTTVGLLALGGLLLSRRRRTA